MNLRIVVIILMLTVAGMPERTAAQAPDSLRQLNQSFYQLTQQLTPAVVQVLSNSYSPVLGKGETASPVALQQSTGSGAILSADGLIVTNAHVVSGATRVRVRLSFVDQPSGRSILRPSGKLLPATIIGIDTETDIALVKVDAENLPFLKFANSDAVRQGQLVLALGNPMGLENSVTMGVVSSVARQLDSGSRMVYIQTDTAINPGNSGGPLVNIDGEIVGINTMIVSRSGGSEGLGFAVPSNIAAAVVDQLSRNGIFTRGDIGVSARTLTPTMVEAFQLTAESGVILEDVFPDSPAFRSGLRIGDIVVSLDGKPMENGRQFHVNIYGKQVNSVVDIELLRNGEKLTKKVVIQPRADDPVRFAKMVDDRVSLISRLAILGIAIDRKIEPMVPGLRRPYGILVARMALTATGQLGLLLPGDVIYAVNGQPVSTLTELRGMLDELAAGGVIVLQIERGGKIQYLEVPLD